MPPGPDWAHARVQAEVVALLRSMAMRAGLEGGGPCNIGAAEDYRVPDGAYLRAGDGRLWNLTAAIVVEIVSPGDESRLKSDFYHHAGVEELLIVDPHARIVEWFVRGTEAFRPTGGSALLGVTAADLADAIDWPA